MSKTYLLIDVHNVCYRNWYTMGNLTHKGNATGVIYGLFRDIRSLQELHNTKHIAFCFDLGQSFRCNVYPGYKAKRKEKQENESEEDQRARADLREQIRKLRTEYLPAIGFKNIFFQDGYEADDIIASVCLESLSEKDQAILVSTDQDLYQLLSEKVSIWNPNRAKIITMKSFLKEYEIPPKMWVKVKSIAGCSTDEVEGVKGVGEKTALKYLRGELESSRKTFQSIIQSKDIRDRNRRLVELPYPGCPKFQLQSDNISNANWEKIIEDLGMKSLRPKMKQKPKEKERKGLLG